MKKYLLKVVCSLIVLSTLVSGMVSCKSTADKLNAMDEFERAETLLEMVNENGEAADSYTIELKMEINGTVSGIGMEATAEGKLRYADVHGENYAYLSETEIKAEIPDYDIEQEMSRTEGYQNGKMFQSYKDDEKEQKLWSSISQADYLKYQEEKDDDLDLDLDIEEGEDVSLSCVYEDDKTWTITYGDFEEDTLKSFLKTFDGIDEVFGEDQEVEDMTLTIKVSEDFYLQSFEIEVVYDVPEVKADSTLSIVAAFKDYNSTEIENVELDSYTEVDDLRLLDKAKEKLDERKNAEAGAFELSISQRYSEGGSTQTDSETDDVTFTNQNGKYTYEVTSKAGAYVYDISYSDGEQKVKAKQNGKTVGEQTAESSDSEAKDFIDGLMDQGNFSVNDVTDILILDAEAGKYQFEVDASNSDIVNSLLASKGGTLSEAEGVFIFVIENDRLTCYTYRLTVDIQGSSSMRYYTLECTCLYVDAEAED